MSVWPTDMPPAGVGPIMPPTWKAPEAPPLTRPSLPMSTSSFESGQLNIERDDGVVRAPDDIPLVMHFAEAAEAVTEEVHLSPAQYDPETQLLRGATPAYAAPEQSWRLTWTTNPYLTGGPSYWDGTFWADLHLDWGDRDWQQFD